VWKQMIRDTAQNVCPTHDARSGCRNEVTRSVWDGAQLLYDIRKLADTSTTSADGYPTPSTFAGSIGYTHGPDLDAPLALFKGTDLVVPLADWQGRMDVGACPTTLCGATYYFPQRLATAFGDVVLPASGPPSWYGELLSDQTDGSGYHYKRNRYYDPVNGRFTQEDPIGLAGDLNLYGFAEGDPVNFSDPFGLKLCFRGDGGDVRRLKQITQDATNTTFGLDKENCVDAGSVRSGGDKSFDGIRAGFVGLVGATSTFDVAFGAEPESPQYSPYRISVFRDADALAYSTGAWGKCDGGRAAFGFAQVMAHELVHHFSVASGSGMTGGVRGENEAVRRGDNVVNAAIGRPLRCRY
jgi:RHS repeat-associated protein